jgi:lambda repressor-like predicted transcriptional regulator|tara:strand:+ start:136 stop:327 length:192 start_codon:yes stop_codon:yes gene_type:complete
MKLIDHLKKEKVSMVYLSNETGLSRPTLYKYLDSPGEFKVKHFKRICELIKVNQREALINLFK